MLVMLGWFSDEVDGGQLNLGGKHLGQGPP